MHFKNNVVTIAKVDVVEIFIAAALPEHQKIIEGFFEWGARIEINCRNR